MKIAVITKAGCPRCEQLKNYLKVKNVTFDEWDLSAPEMHKKLLSDQIFTREFCTEDVCTINTPVVYDIDEKIYYSKELFGASGVRKQFIDRWISKK